jgi:hypothetical protein
MSDFELTTSTHLRIPRRWITGAVVIVAIVFWTLRK